MVGKLYGTAASRPRPVQPPRRAGPSRAFQAAVRRGTLRQYRQRQPNEEACRDAVCDEQRVRGEAVLQRSVPPESGKQQRNPGQHTADQQSPGGPARLGYPSRTAPPIENAMAGAMSCRTGQKSPHHRARSVSPNSTQPTTAEATATPPARTAARERGIWPGRRPSATRVGGRLPPVSPPRRAWMLSWRHDRTLPSRASRDVIPVRTGIAISLTAVPRPEASVEGPLAREARPDCQYGGTQRARSAVERFCA